MFQVKLYRLILRGYYSQCNLVSPTYMTAAAELFGSGFHHTLFAGKRE